jgi:hypothetical protein
MGDDPAEEFAHAVRSRRRRRDDGDLFLRHAVRERITRLKECVDRAAIPPVLRVL